MSLSSAEAAAEAGGDLIFFFIGMHTSEKDFGVEGYHTCTRCGHVGDWHLIKATTY